MTNHLRVLAATEEYLDGIRELCDLREKICMDRLEPHREHEPYTCLICGHKAEYDVMKKHLLSAHKKHVDSSFGLDVYFANTAFCVYVKDQWVACITNKALFYCKLCKDTLVDYSSKSQMHQHIK